MRVLAAVSGGVDSAVALARAVDAGHDVVAVHLALNSDRAATREGSRGCCTLSDAHDARRAADLVGVPFYVWNVAGDFRERVIDDFVSEYEAGRTPNPCIRCNEHIKFAAVLDKASALGFDAVATGHYAQVQQSETGPILRRSVDIAKDQSYVLAVLGNDRLRKCMFPVGDTNKTQIRAEAKERGLTVAAKPDSHDICFIPDGDTAGFLEQRLGEQRGPIIDDVSGEKIGEHGGTYGFTIGQRKGIAVDQPTHSGRPRYVLGIEPVSKTVVVGERDRLAVSSIRADQAVWRGSPPNVGQDLLVQVRAHADPVPARVVQADASEFEVDILGELYALAPGQSCVLYAQDQVIGQGTVSS